MPSLTIRSVNGSRGLIGKDIDVMTGTLAMLGLAVEIADVENVPAGFPWMFIRPFACKNAYEPTEAFKPRSGEQSGVPAGSDRSAG
jgi:hypothetical protein